VEEAPHQLVMVQTEQLELVVAVVEHHTLKIVMMVVLVVLEL
tara:strand:- start:284 stop:409 length:126 start_codon:yes stop_codon:yes gene_type:complete